LKEGLKEIKKKRVKLSVSTRLFKGVFSKAMYTMETKKEEQGDDIYYPPDPARYRSEGRGEDMQYYRDQGGNGSCILQSVSRTRGFGKWGQKKKNSEKCFRN